jgi:phage baseplate assembly protein gpV
MSRDPLLEIHDALGDLYARHADLEARLERMFRKGKVTDVDAVNGLYRQEIGLDDNGQTVKSPWLPYSQIAGARKSHSPPSVGEQYLLINPDGSPDFTQGLGVPHGWYSANPSPSTNPGADVTTRGTTTDTTTASSRTIQVGGSSIVIEDGLITLTAIKIVTVGETHLGSAGGVPAAQQGTIDTGGFADETNLAQKVFVT